jgi:hypothetical protein
VVVTATQEATWVRVGASVVSFDGAVVEFFGFMEIGSHRFHVAMLKEIEIVDRRLLGTAINVAAHPSTSWQVAPTFRDGQRAQLEALIVDIHAARDAWPL